MFDHYLRRDAKHLQTLAFKKTLQIKALHRGVCRLAVEIIRQQKLIEDRERFEEIMRAIRVCRQDSVAIHQLTMNRVRRFMRKNSHIIVGATKARAVKHTLGSDETSRKTAAPSIRSWHNIHPPICAIQ